ncbi:hypothetical protein FRX31_001937 [Thalictrum thalictroides]|uniref:Ubiquitin-like protease family profile domain-containing protein n=1 Tax=Thalictrum thalictroides TaxID=46969 RepID=A0A7J6XFA8_THATH|nr:hypothetical protein FRX31_001937 [Thalictrum thalictroides]
MGMFFIKKGPIKQQQDVPHQGSSVDCSLFVCKFMYNVVSEREMSKVDYTEKMMKRMRAEMTYDLLNEPGLSFNKAAWDQEQTVVKILA